MGGHWASFYQTCGGGVQATSMASDEISEEAVYTCTGNPLPRDVQQIVEWIMNQNFAEAFASAPLENQLLVY